VKEAGRAAYPGDQQEKEVVEGVEGLAA